MRKLLLLVLFLALKALPAQNLVPNGSFETHDSCASISTGFGMYATGWMNLHTSSADYFNACNEDGVLNVPLSQFGFQYPSDGEAYVGMATSGIEGGPWYREMVGMELSEPLQPGVPICLSFKMAVGGFGSWSGNSSYHTCKGIGLKFFTTLPNDWYSYLYPNSAALHLEEVPTDTSMWYEVAGTYFPDSAYTYVVVGNFFADSLSAVTLLDSTGFGTAEPSYAFVDDVRASFDLSYCTEEVGVTAPVTASFKAYPMPFGDRLYLAIDPSMQPLTRYDLLDMMGRSVRQGMLRRDGSGYVITFDGLEDGPYLLQLSLSGNACASLSVIHHSP